ncbi:hypothetical protein JRO89_XS06G0208400 [Xanthoceras sorbifolium]|uniref:CNH domain-containing protein n=1 Tax=Xanthoceras sorbifolium TaxID=99658 RepID=A0ABQ8HZ07_9ROSI|nr:hypothetical protein JRO89_XS06G0208400 [Xanthoceras sorbifolium]
MAKSKPKSRTVVEPLAQLDLSAHSRSSPVRSLSLSSVSDSQTLIYVGTQSGFLILLSLNAQNVSFLKGVLVGNSPVESIIVLGDVGAVLVLCDECLFLVDSLLIQPPKKLGFLKGINLIAKRIRSSESESSNLSEINSVNLSNNSSTSTSTSQRLLQKLGSGIRANGVKVKEQEQHRRGNNVFAVVSGKRLILIELVLGRDMDSLIASVVILKEIQCIDGVQTMVWLNDSIIVGTAKEYSLFSCVTSQSGVIFSLPDVSSLPFLKLLLKERKVLLLVDNVGVVVDVHGQPVGGSLVFRRSPDSIGELLMYVVVVGDGKVELYHKSSGICIQTVTFGGEGVGQCIAANEESGNGKLLVVATPTKVICYQKVPYEEQIKDLLRKKDFKEAISLVEELECEGEMSKEMLSFVHAQVGFLLLFDLHFEEAVNHFLHSETMQPSEVFPFIMRDPNRWSLLVPRNRYWGLHPPPAPLEDVVDNGLMAIQRAIFLRKAGVETAIDDDFLSNPPNRADMLELAIKNIIRYLEVSREKELTFLVKEGVDTLLMYLYRALNRVHDMEKLAASENSCIVVCVPFHLCLFELIITKSFSGACLKDDRTPCMGGAGGDPAVENDLHDDSTDAISGREIAAMEASKILEESSDEDLILQHLGWVCFSLFLFFFSFSLYCRNWAINIVLKIADINPVLAVKVLTSGERPNQLSPDEVIAAIDSKRVEILQSYLQWLIEDQESYDIQFHTLYALSLAKSALESFEAASSSKNTGTGGLEETKDSDFGKNSIFQSPVRERLQIFLQSSDLYDPEEVLDLIEGSELWLEKAILYRKLGQETLVLQVLALKLEDSEAAEEYCAEIGRPDAYMQLLDMYLDPHDGKEPMFKAAVRLLHNHGESLDPLQVLETLSPDMPLQLASETILRMLRARLHHHCQGQIVHNLSRAVDIDARLARLEERSRHVQINDESLCDSCQARLGTKLFAMYPDDTIVCYKCFRRQGESTSVTGRDFKQDVLFKPGWLVMR